MPDIETAKTAGPDTPGRQYLNMAKKWVLLHDLCGGTQAMRDAGKRWLPQEPNEEEKQYQNRLERSFLYNAYKDTIDKIVAKPFSRQVQITKDKLPEQLAPIEEDVDRTGKDLTSFLREVFEAGTMYGLTHVLVDFPSIASTPLTLEAEKQLGIRPVFVHVKPPDLIAWQTTSTSLGVEELSSIRFKECRLEADGEFGEKEVTYIRQYTKTDWKVYKADEKGDFFEVASGTHTFGRVPLFTVYFNRTGFMVADPPLEDLAWMNLVHWQSYSDHRNILRFARVGLLFLKGLTPEETEAGIVIGPGRIIRTRSEVADMRYVEYGGTSIQAGERDLQVIEQRMEALGNQPLMSRTGDQTATGQAIDEARTQADIKAWVRVVEKFGTQLYRAAAEWMKLELDPEFAVDLNDDFGAGFRGVEDMPHLISMRSSGNLSQTTFLRETKRRGILSEEVDIEAEIAQIEEEGPPLSALPPMPTDDEEKPDDEETREDEEKEPEEEPRIPPEQPEA